MADRDQKDLTRRGFLAATGSSLAAGAAHAAQNSEKGQDEVGDERKVEFDNPQVGQPVSQTARAQDGQPVVPGPAPKKLGYCIVGLGKFAVGQILPAFEECEHSKPVAVVSGDRQKAEAIATRYSIPQKGIYNYKDFDAIQDNSDIDIVYIILPNALHAEYTIRAHKAGKHVLCEKPMATTVKDCERMIAASEKAGKKLMIAYRVQYEPYNMQAIEWSREKKYGPIDFIVSDTVLDVGGPNQWRLDRALSGGGSLVDIGIYSLNATRYLTGEEPVEVNAIAYQDKSDPRFSEVEQRIAFQLRFPSGVLANCTSAYSTHQVNRYTVMCKEGWYTLDPATTYTGHRIFHGTKDRKEQLFLPHVSHFAAEMDHLSHAIKDNQPVKTPGEEGLKDVKYIRQIYEAARTGKTIKLSS